LSASDPDVKDDVLSRARAREMRAGKNGGRLLVLRKGDPSSRGSGSTWTKPAALVETLDLARAAAPAAVRALISALGSPDDRVRVMASQLLLDRALGRPREAPAEVPQEARVDLTRLTGAELRVLHRLVESGRLTETPTEGDEVMPEIDGLAVEPQ
jgi:hypothetical protein